MVYRYTGILVYRYVHQFTKGISDENNKGKLKAKAYKTNNYQKLYTVLSCLGVFNFCTCCKILISLVCFVASFKLFLCNCCWLTVCIVVVVLCVLLSYVYLLYCVCIAVFTLDAGLLARSQYSEGPATGHLDTSFSWFPCA